MYPTRNLLKALANPAVRRNGVKGMKSQPLGGGLRPTKLGGATGNTPIKLEPAHLTGNGYLTKLQAHVAAVRREVYDALDHKKHEDLAPVLHAMKLGEFGINQTGYINWVHFEARHIEGNLTRIYRSVAIKKVHDRYSLVYAITKVPVPENAWEEYQCRLIHDKRLVAGGTQSGPGYQVEETFHSDVGAMRSHIWAEAHAWSPEVVRWSKRDANHWRHAKTDQANLLNNILVKAGVAKGCLVKVILGGEGGRYRARHLYALLRHWSMMTAIADHVEAKMLADGIITKLTSTADRFIQVAITLLPKWFPGVKPKDVVALDDSICGAIKKERRKSAFRAPIVETDNLPPVN